MIRNMFLIMTNIGVDLVAMRNEVKNAGAGIANEVLVILPINLLIVTNIILILLNLLVLLVLVEHRLTASTEKFAHLIEMNQDVNHLIAIANKNTLPVTVSALLVVNVNDLPAAIVIVTESALLDVSANANALRDVTVPLGVSASALLDVRGNVSVNDPLVAIESVIGNGNVLLVTVLLDVSVIVSVTNLHEEVVIVRHEKNVKTLHRLKLNCVHDNSLSMTIFMLIGIVRNLSIMMH